MKRPVMAKGSQFRHKTSCSIGDGGTGMLWLGTGFAIAASAWS